MSLAGPNPLKLAVLISGGGSTLANLIERIGDGRLRNVRIERVISSRGQVGGVQVARAAGLPLSITRKRDFPSEAAFSAALTTAVDAAGVDLVVMGGFLCHWAVPPHFHNRVLNIHPALLPAFGGRGMYGRRVHEAVLAAGAKESGCTVHLVTQEYDCGPILAQSRLAILPGETPDSLANRVAALERELYPAVIQQVADRGVGWLIRAQAGA